MADAHKLKELSVHEVSFVDYPANQHAKIKLTKRADRGAPAAETRTEEDRAESKIDSVLAILKGLFAQKPAQKLDTGDGAVSFDDALTCYGLSDPLWRANNALQASLESIIQDSSGADKNALLKETMDEFTTFIQQLVAGAISKAIPSASQETQKMSFAVKKALGLGAAATEAETEEKFAKLLKAAALGALSWQERRYTEVMKLEGEDLAKFAEATPEDRAAAMKAKPMPKDDDEDEAVAAGKGKKTPAEDETPEGQKKARLAALAKSNPEVAELLRKSALDEIEKRASKDMQFVGKAGDIAALLYEIRTEAGNAVGDKLEKMLSALSKRLATSQLFKEAGSAEGDTGTSAHEQLKALASEIQKRDNLPTSDAGRATAMTKARDQNPELAKRETQERKSAA